MMLRRGGYAWAGKQARRSGPGVKHVLAVPCMAEIPLSYFLSLFTLGTIA